MTDHTAYIVIEAKGGGGGDYREMRVTLPPTPDGTAAAARIVELIVGTYEDVTVNDIELQAIAEGGRIDAPRHRRWWSG